MQKLIRVGSICLAIAGAIATGQEAFAQLPSVFKVQNPTSGVQSVVVTGTPRTQIPISFTGRTVTKKIPIRTNACGFGILRNASQYGLSQISVGAGAYSFTAQGILVESITNGIPTCSISIF
ncbi:hypothetical protein PseudUWO311_03415 [Pseudanabaena sp. UWO311]|uniref:hypothetical protein n=1 Tax=Pseudanabaena sp. UWO311 TaxID=2487337 RepID=UPI001158FF0E|nr:hypothetical protein PseudUWO311_03415 [Pseudanabaena sp. UWO311]